MCLQGEPSQADPTGALSSDLPRGLTGREGDVRLYVFAPEGVTMAEQKPACPTALDAALEGWGRAMPGEREGTGKLRTPQRCDGMNLGGCQRTEGEGG